MLCLLCKWTEPMGSRTDLWGSQQEFWRALLICSEQFLKGASRWQGKILSLPRANKPSPYKPMKATILDHHHEIGHIFLPTFIFIFLFLPAIYFLCSWVQGKPCKLQQTARDVSIPSTIPPMSKIKRLLITESNCFEKQISNLCQYHLLPLQTQSPQAINDIRDEINLSNEKD